MANKQYADTGVAGVRQDQFQNQTNTDSKLTAEQSQILVGLVPLNANSQKITSLDTATTGSDALNRAAGDSRFY